MAVDHEHEALRELEPPPGGIERFEQRLVRMDHSARARVGAVGAGLAACVLAIVVIGIARQTTDIEPDGPFVSEAPGFDRLLGRTMRETTLSISINDEPVPVAVVTSADSKIRIVEIETD